jgi:hypothetical protein
MAMKNRYAIRARISEHQFRHIVRLFALDLDATQIAALSGFNRNTINRYLRGIRERVAEYCEHQSPFAGEIEVDESYFGARRMVRGSGGVVVTRSFAICGVIHRTHTTLPSTK